MRSHDLLYLLVSQHELKCWDTIEYDDGQQVPGERARRSHEQTLLTELISVAMALTLH